MPERKVECVCRTGRTNPHERIKSIGGGRGLSAWKLSEREAIDKIEKEGWSFYALDRAGRQVKVVVAMRLGRKYLKTEADGLQPMGLLSLPPCPLPELRK
jgi:hypothetical protein